MRIKFRTIKLANIRDYFDIGWRVDDEADFALCIVFFGREYCWDFYKKDSAWSLYMDEEYDLSQLS